MTTTFPLQIISPAKPMFVGEAEMVEIPGTEGDFGVLPGHAPLLSMIRPGVVSIHLPDRSRKLLWIEGGYADVSPEGTTILGERMRELAPEEVAGAHAELATRALAA